MIEIFPRRTKETFFRLDKVSFILIIDDITLFVGVKDIFHCRIKKMKNGLKEVSMAMNSILPYMFKEVLISNLKYQALVIPRHRDGRRLYKLNFT